MTVTLEVSGTSYQIEIPEPGQRREIVLSALSEIVYRLKRPALKTETRLEVILARLIERCPDLVAVSCSWPKQPVIHEIEPKRPQIKHVKDARYTDVIYGSRDRGPRRVQQPTDVVIYGNN